MIKLLSGVLFSLAMLITSCGGDEPTTSPIEPMKPVDMIDNEMNDLAGEIRDISSMEFVAEMGIGWNLGNSFDVVDADKTVWGNPLPTSNHINAIKELGFETLRIPVTWDFHMMDRAPYTVEAPYLARVKNIVEAGLRNGMHVIINTHHDEWIIPTNAQAPAVNARLASLWTQIAKYFEAYGDKLIFETMNETRLRGSAEEWSGGTAEGRAVLNDYHKTCVDAIRATGGNNAKRHIMVSTYAASTSANAMADLVIPEDPNIIISIHTYFPWSFAGQEGGGTNIWGSNAEKAALDAELDRVKERWITQENRPVILGEWGSIDKNNLTARVDYAAYYARAAMTRGMIPVIWDDGGNFGLYDRHAGNWKYESIALAAVNAAK